MKLIYLDNNATTEIDPRVREVMQVELASPPSNPSSVHTFGQEARKRLVRARQTIATALGVKPRELIFTSGGTEALNSLLRGFFAEKKGGHLVTSSIEHSSLYTTAKALEKEGTLVTFLEPGLKGFVTAQEVEATLRPGTSLVALGAVSGETGIKNPIEAIAQLCHAKKIPFLVDGVALLGKELFSIPEGVSAIAFSGHKLHGPKGIGLAFARNSFKWQPQLTGGDQEWAKRAGTENLPGIIGLAKAIELLQQELPKASRRMEILRDRFESALAARYPLTIHGKESPRICNTSNIAFSGIDGETLLLQLDRAGILASHGSACASGALEPSRVLLNMGVPKTLARSSLRFSLSRFTTEEEIDIAIAKLLQLLG